MDHERHMVKERTVKGGKIQFLDGELRWDGVWRVEMGNLHGGERSE